MKSIVLPAGSEHVQFGELAHLIADALWPDAGPDDDRMTYAFARINLDAELARAVDSGALPVKDPLTLGPHTYPVGYALKTALVTVDDLQRFVSDRGLSVIVETPETQAAQVTSPSGDDMEEQAAAADDHDKTLAALFDPVPVEELEKMFPAGGKWKLWAEKAASNGLKNARTNRAKFNPYIAGKWFVSNGAEGWDTARRNRVLANNLPARSRDDAHLLTGGID